MDELQLRGHQRHRQAHDAIVRLHHQGILFRAEHDHVLVFRAVRERDVLSVGVPRGLRKRGEGEEQQGAKNQRSDFHEGGEISKFPRGIQETIQAARRGGKRCEEVRRHPRGNAPGKKRQRCPDLVRATKKLEAGAGIEPANRGFADLGLTTWLPRRRENFQHRL